MAATVGGQWGYSVPLDGTNGNPRPTATRSTSHEVRSLSRQGSNWDLQSDSEATKTRKVSTRNTHAAATRKRSRNALRDTKRERPDKREEGLDDSAWIHRDKLAQIEIREMEEAGFPVHRSQRSVSAGPGSEYDAHARSMSHSESRPATSQDQHYDEIYDDEPGVAYGGAERKRVSTIPAADEEEAAYEAGADYNNYQPPLDDSTAEMSTNNARHHAVRPSTSRIPISAKGGVPVPSDVVERDAPLPRSRAGSSAHTNNWDELHYARRGRGGSMSSQLLPDDPEADALKGTPPGSSKQFAAGADPSPPKSRGPQKTAPGARKASGPAARPGSSQGNKGRRPSASAAKRPESSQGHKTQTSVGYTWSPPEGDAPWITNMYKPDPRLPPDQQMLPTHMKRMMQEQWEKEGKAGTAYDRDFGLMNQEELHKPASPASPGRVLDANPMDLELQDFPPPSEHAENTPPTAHPASPTSPHDTKSDTNSIRPGTTGGYRITPTITATPNMYRTPLTSPQLTSPQLTSPIAPNNPPPPHVPTMHEKDDTESGGGCCCVIM